MADRHPSAIKRNRQNLSRRTRNQSVRTSLKTATKKFLKAVEEQDWDGAQTLFREVASKFDRAGKSGIVHKNLASRKKSRLQLRLNEAQEAATTAARPSRRIVTKAAKTTTKRTKRRK